MNLADLAIRRPIFITCIVLVMLAVGLQSLSHLGVDLFPDVTFPVVTVTTSYPGAGPAEIETLVTKPLEDEISTLSGIKRLTSVNKEGVSRVIAEFTLETDVKFAEQEIRDRVGSTKSKLPLDIKEPVIRRIDPSDQPVLTLSLDAELPEGKMFDLADDVIRPKLEQVNNVGVVDVVGGRKREIHVALDRRALKAHEISATGVVAKVGSAGENTPLGKVERGGQDLVFRALGEFHSMDDIKNTIVNFFGSDVPTTIGQIGNVYDTLEDETSRAYVNGKRALTLQCFRQSGANTIAVVDGLKKQMARINKEMENQPGKPHLTMVRDGAVWIHANVDDVEESIFMGVALAVLVVFFFLGNGRSTIITGLALPNSLIGSFILMSIAGFTINIMSLLALSLSVGLLVDDAIVVRENIFRHIEMGKDPITAAKDGTAEVRLAVIATTLAVISVFGPVAFLSGVVGQFFKQFGATICFAMAISLFDALTIAPMLSAYFAGNVHGNQDTGSLWSKTGGALVRGFDRFQGGLEKRYVRLLGWVLHHPLKSLGAIAIIALASCSSVRYVPKTFLPPQDAGEFAVALDLPPGTNLDAMNELGGKVDQVIRAHKEIEVSSMTIGSSDGEPNYANFYVRLVPRKDRKINTIQMKQMLREELKPFAYANPAVTDYDAVGGGQRPFNLNFIGLDEKQLEDLGMKVLARLKKNPGLKDVDINFRPGKPEFQVKLDETRSKALGISSKTMGTELRTLVEGLTPAKFRELGREYDVRVRLQDDQRDLKVGYNQTYVPNVNGNLVRLSDVATGESSAGPATINRQDRGRLVQISADITPGAGMGDVMADIDRMLKTDIPLPLGVRYAYVGQAENFQELGASVVTAMGFGVLFIFLVLSSLYESFVTPFTIMLALPLAMCGSFVALAVTHQTLDIFSMIGSIMLLGVASKNSILLVDYAKQQIDAGMDRTEALLKAGSTRLRPILMTTMALIAGTFPIALGLNEASAQRVGMGISIIGGLISSTLLTLVVVPAAFSYIDRFRVWSASIMKWLFAPKRAKPAPEEHGELRQPVETA
jgi:HAE1 family hydrophobic/amphiphilic exporter-1